MANLNLMQSIGGPSGSCSKLDGLRLSEAKEMAKLGGGGHIFVVEGEGTCVEANWVQSLTCYRDDGDCRIGSKNSKAINEELFNYVNSTSYRKPRSDRLFTIQAHWQYNQNAIVKMILAGSSVLEDSLRSEVNKNVLSLVPQLKDTNFFQVDNACYYGVRNCIDGISDHVLPLL
ncbi:hypothetical protein FOL47_003462 [Perkinsus chesapeaki]|uniref:Uncharacterized protein n=1 Tax=Perkinsus chesapeaki TaxID=330153 RepID=A0A7J6M7S6_PERCH|nr:hypothetical protein FOL47_003462 [Perkinsus chesapeaki]